MKFGHGKPIFIIAEVGSNWTTITDCLTSIQLAASCGADAVKFQLFSHKSLYGYPGKLPYELPKEWLPKLKEKADAAGIEFMCSAFSVEDLLYVDQFVSYHKIASSHNQHVPFLVEAWKTGKPVFVSTGGTSFADLNFSYGHFDKDKTVLMYCVSEYPANKIDPRTVSLLAKEMKTKLVGISDHSNEVYSVPICARDNGAVAIEKHVNFVGSGSVDAGHSLSTDDFAKMVKALRSEAPTYAGTGLERDMMLLHNVRIVAIRDIKAGEVLRYEDSYGFYRSKIGSDRGYAPNAAATHFEGRPCPVDVKRGDVVPRP